MEEKAGQCGCCGIIEWFKRLLRGCRPCFMRDAEVDEKACRAKAAKAGNSEAPDEHAGCPCCHPVDPASDPVVTGELRGSGMDDGLTALFESLDTNLTVLDAVLTVPEANHDNRKAAARALTTEVFRGLSEADLAKPLVKTAWDDADYENDRRFCGYLKNKDTVGEVVETLVAQIEKQKDAAERDAPIRNLDYIAFMIREVKKSLLV